MKKIELTFLTVLFVISLVAGSTQAGGHGYYGGSGHGYHGGSGHGYYGGGWGHGYYGGWWPGIYWGGPVVVGSPWYPYDYYPQPPTVIQQAPVYVQPQQQEDANYWYYCENPKGYYPYVTSCPGGWMKVVPTPQTAPPN